MQSQQMYPEENRYSAFEPAFNMPSSAEYDYRDPLSSAMGEKLRPRRARKSRRGWFWQRVVLAILSLPLFFVLSAMMLAGDNGAMGVLLIVAILLSVNILVYLLSGQPWGARRQVRQFGLRFALALISGALLFPLSFLMTISGNGPVGVVLVWVIILTMNAISYLTAFYTSQ